MDFVHSQVLIKQYLFSFTNKEGYTITTSFINNIDILYILNVDICIKLNPHALCMNHLICPFNYPL